jgi:hypothetical protein
MQKKERVRASLKTSARVPVRLPRPRHAGQMSDVSECSVPCLLIHPALRGPGTAAGIGRAALHI